MSELIIKLITGHLKIIGRHKQVVSFYLFSLMIAAPKHTLTWASAVSELNKSQYCRLLQKHDDVAKNNLELLSKKIARIEAVKRTPVVEGASWTVIIICDSSLHKRSTLHTDNSKKFNHGQGYVIGHQWTNIVLLINGKTIPLPPIPFISKEKCEELKIDYETEHDKVIEYFKNLKLEDWIGDHDPSEILCLKDSGYDDRRIDKTIIQKKWDAIGSIKKSDSAKTTKETKAKKFKRVDQMFKDLRGHSPWVTIRIAKGDAKKKKMRRYRARQSVGKLKGLGDREVKLVCSECPKSKKKLHLMSTNTTVSLRQIILGYLWRWPVELFHKDVKSYLGLEDLGAHNFTSQEAHVHWVYAAYLLLMEMNVEKKMGIKERQLEFKNRVDQDKELKKLNKFIQLGSRFCGGDQVKKFCQNKIEDLQEAV